MGEDGRTLVTKNCYRMLHTLYNLHPSPEPNLTVLWAKHLPENWKRYVAKVSCDTDAIQYENDDDHAPGLRRRLRDRLLRFGDARRPRHAVLRRPRNLAKLVLLAINGGMDEVKEDARRARDARLARRIRRFRPPCRAARFLLQWLAKTYVDAMNTIHYMHDKYAYEKEPDGAARHERAPPDGVRHRGHELHGRLALGDQIRKGALHPRPGDRPRHRFRDDRRIPCFGNDDERVDAIACEQVRRFYNALKEHQLYRGAEHTLSILTITSNVMYGKKTGNTPDGRKARRALAPGANPMSGRDKVRRAGRAQLRREALLRLLPRRHLQHVFDHPPRRSAKPRRSASRISCSF